MHGPPLGFEIEFDCAPYRLSGLVVGTLFNDRAALEALGHALHEPPYRAPPRAPVLYLKPRNTLCSNHAAVRVPPDAAELEVGANLGIVIGRTACRVAERDAPGYVAGYTIVGDVSVPQHDYFRPGVRSLARDGFCPIGPAVVAREQVGDADALAVSVFVDGVPALRTSTAGMVRPLARLLADVTEFMTLAPGDVLLLGASGRAPRVRAGQRVAIEIEGLGRLENPIVAAAKATA